MDQNEKVEQAQLVINKTVEALRKSGFFGEIFLGASVDLEESGRYIPLVSTSTMDKLPLHSFLAQCQSMLLETEIERARSLEERETRETVRVE